MGISGTEPSSVILSQKKNFQKLKRDVQNVPKQAEAKRVGVDATPVAILGIGNFCLKLDV